MVAPTNHLACGSCQSRTLVHGVNQSRALAHSAQKASGSSAAHLARRSSSARWGMWALAAKSAAGGKTRVSLRTLVMFAAGEDIAVSERAGRGNSKWAPRPQQP